MYTLPTCSSIMLCCVLELCCCQKYAILLYSLMKEVAMDTYYEEILKEIAKLMEAKNYDEAYAILNDELSMPYIPKESEEKMIAYYNECRSELALNKVQRTYDEDDIAQLLKGSLEEQFAAVELLKNSNIRKHIKDVDSYLCDDAHALIRAYLIEALMEQNVSEEIHMKEHDMEITFIPCALDAPMDSEGAVLAAKTLCSWFENDDPSFLMMCMESLVKEAYLRMPFAIEEDEAMMIATAIVGYVFEANGDKSAFEAFISEKSLAQTGGFDLLLYKYGI